MTSTPRRVYLDNAATSWPKPEAVYEAVDHYQRCVGTSPSRGVYAEARRADGEVRAARSAIAALLGAEDPQRIAFTFNCTDALNLAIHGILRPGDHVVTSDVDHNSVLRPLQWLQQRGTIDVTRVGCGAEGIIDPDEVRAAFRPNTRLVALVHASNVTGSLQPLADVGRAARESNILFLVDAAQSVGHLPMNVDELKVDLLAAPGHKGLLGPLGTGFLYLRSGVERHLESMRQGGTGTRSDRDVQPDTLPDKYEPGNLNVAGICGLRAGVEYLAKHGLERVRRHELELVERLRQGLADIPGVRLFGPRETIQQVGVLSMTHPNWAAEDLAKRLDTSFRVEVRAGIHCAPHIHKRLGTDRVGGTVRFSLGPFNTEADVDQAIEAVGQTVAGGGVSR